MTRGERRAWARWRLALGAVLTLVVGVPLGLPLLDLGTYPAAWRAWNEGGRLALLAADSAVLAAGVLALTLPAGTVAAFLFYRTDLPLHRTFRFLTVLTLFVPLPLLAAAWEGVFSFLGWLPVGAPWAERMAAAVWIHAAGALPWVVLIVGEGLRWVEADLEEEALLVVGPWRVLTRVTLIRCRASLLGAALWVAVQTTTEITVTDAMQVRTFAEEVYTQLVLGSQESVARAVAVALPAVLLTWLVVVRGAWRVEGRLPPLWSLGAKPHVFRLRRGRAPALALVCGAAVALAGVPLASLVWKTGQVGNPPTWSAATAWFHLANAVRLRGGMVVGSFLVAAASGLIAAGLALVTAWLAVGGRRFAAVVLGLLAAAWVVPGPVAGIGLKEAIGLLVRLPSDALAAVFYYGPSPAPIVWAQVVRFLPCAVAVLWPAVRLIPEELHETARVDGAGPVGDLRHLVFPLALPAGRRAALAVAALALGELSAAKLVETPGAPTFAHAVFTMMHYGLTNDLAALCLLPVGLVALVGAAAALGGVWRGRGGRMKNGEPKTESRE